MEANNLLNTEFKLIVISMLKELSENYNSMKRDIETMKKNQSVKNSMEFPQKTKNGTAF